MPNAEAEPGPAFAPGVEIDRRAGLATIDGLRYRVRATRQRVTGRRQLRVQCLDRATARGRPASVGWVTLGADGAPAHVQPSCADGGWYAGRPNARTVANAAALRAVAGAWAATEALVALLLAAPEAQPPGRMDPELYAGGRRFLVLAGPRSWVIEAWVRALGRACATPVDWHFVGGRAAVACLPEHAAQVAAQARRMVPALAEAAATLAARPSGPHGYELTHCFYEDDDDGG